MDRGGTGNSHGCAVDRGIGLRRPNLPVIAIKLFGRARGNPDAKRLAQWTGHDRFAIDLLGGKFVASARNDFQLITRIGGGNGDRARGRILTEEQRLWTF